MRRPSHHLTLTTKVGFLVGWMFFAMAFLLAAAESVNGQGFITTTNELLLSLIPGKWIAFKYKYDSIVMDILLQSVFLLPGWLLAGLPAGFLIWTCRPHREEVDPELYESLTTFDRLAALAEEEGAQDDDPTFQDYDLNDYDDDHLKEDVKPAKAYIKEWHDDQERGLDLPEKAQGPEERMQGARDKLSIPFDKLS